MKINRLWMALMAMTALLVCSCEEKVTPVFPTEVATYAVEPGDEVVVTFDANTDWLLSSDAVWCKTDGFLDAYGKVGEQRVTFTISADGQTLDADQANIRLRMGDEIRVIAIVTRAGFTNAVVLGNDSVDYVHNQTLTIASEGVATLAIKDISFDANNLYISTTAEWLDIQRDGEVLTFTVKEEYLKYTQANATDSICFSNRETPMMRLHVQYTGMDANKIILAPASQWGVTVSADGTTYRGPSLDGAAQEIAAPMQVAVTALNDAYTLYYASYDKANGCVLVDAAASWIAVEDDAKGNLSISFMENVEAGRSAYLLVLPNAISEALTDVAMVSDYLFENSTGIAELKVECEQYLVAEFTQESALSSSFHLIDGPSFEYLEVALETDETYVAFADSNGISANNLYKAELEFAHPYIFNPMLPLATWDPSTGNGSIAVFNVITGEYAVEGEDYLIEPTMMEAEGDDYMLLQFRSYIENDYIIFFVDAQKVYHKALVVTVKL